MQFEVPRGRVYKAALLLQARCDQLARGHVVLGDVVHGVQIYVLPARYADGLLLHMLNNPLHLGNRVRQRVDWVHEVLLAWLVCTQGDLSAAPKMVFACQWRVVRVRGCMAG
jgi:hypothetical protein